LSGAPIEQDLASVLARLERWGAGRGWVGPDPYEGLNSPFGRLAPTRRSRQAVTQLYKRLPLTPRGPLGAPSRPNAKALALVLSGYATEAGRRLPGASRYLTEIPAQLAEMNLLDGAAGWGYHFDVQTRNLRYDSRTPNAIATCFVVGALCDAHEATGDQETETLPSAGDAIGETSARTGKVSIRSATFEDLRGLGMSVTQAKRLLHHRDEKALSSPDDLDQVLGLPKQFRAELKERLTV
jgi:DNA uptake protein ComE-like DNA-binding protein